MSRHPSLIEVKSVVCPPWCTTPQEEHLRELYTWHGGALHHSEIRRLHDADTERGWEVQVTFMARADGSPDGDEVTMVNLWEPAENMSVAEARALGQALLDACDEAES